MAQEKKKMVEGRGIKGGERRRNEKILYEVTLPSSGLEY